MYVTVILRICYLEKEIVTNVFLVILALCCLMYYQFLVYSRDFFL